MFPNIKVLVVDDHEFLREAFKKLLEFLGVVEISMAAEGGAALEILRNGNFDLVMTDRSMPPGMGGFELIRQIREDRNLEGLKIILMTAEDRQSWESRALQAGADAFLSKPFRLEELEALLKQMFPNE